MERKFLIIGGDLRQLKLAEGLKQHGFDVGLFGFDKAYVKDNLHLFGVLEEAIAGADYIVLGLPAVVGDEYVNTPMYAGKLHIDKLLEAISPNVTVFGGMLSDSLMDKAARIGIHIRDYFKREELAILNAIPTAEGAIQIAMEETARTIHGSNALCIGFGRVGKAICKILAGMSANVFVTDTDINAMAWANAYGYKAADELSLCLPHMDLIFNTVPRLVLNREMLTYVNKSSLIIDVASKPGGVDFIAAGELSLNAMWTLSLPGKVAPLTAGMIIMQTILNMIAMHNSQ